MSFPIELQGKRALVCGASKGIGKATAMVLADLGAKVTLLARSAEPLNAVAATINSTHGLGTATPLVADLDDHAALGARIQQHLDAFGPHHIWVNNTGGPPGGPLFLPSLPPFQHRFLATCLRHRSFFSGCSPE